MTPLAASISDATIWRVTFDDTRSVNYDRNSFIIQATELEDSNPAPALYLEIIVGRNNFLTNLLTIIHIEWGPYQETDQTFISRCKLSND